MTLLKLINLHKDSHKIDGTERHCAVQNVRIKFCANYSGERIKSDDIQVTWTVSHMRKPIMHPGYNKYFQTNQGIYISFSNYSLQHWKGA